MNNSSILRACWVEREKCITCNMLKLFWKHLRAHSHEKLKQKCIEPLQPHFSYFSSTVPRFVSHIMFIRKQRTYEFFWELNSLMLMEYQMGVWGGRCCPEQFKPKWSLDFCWEKTPPGRLVCWIASRNS